jgi:hypothetical protein
MDSMKPQFPSKLDVRQPRKVPLLTKGAIRFPVSKKTALPRPVQMFLTNRQKEVLHITSVYSRRMAIRYPVIGHFD